MRFNGKKYSAQFFAADITSTRHNSNDCCLGCVYYPPNLPADAYAPEDFDMLQQKSCSFDFQPEDQHCLQMRKSSCSLINL